MKKEYVRPSMVCETFAADEYGIIKNLMERLMEFIKERVTRFVELHILALVVLHMKHR